MRNNSTCCHQNKSFLLYIEEMIICCIDCIFHKLKCESTELSAVPCTPCPPLLLALLYWLFDWRETRAAMFIGGGFWSTTEPIFAYFMSGGLISIIAEFESVPSGLPTPSCELNLPPSPRTLLSACKCRDSWRYFLRSFGILPSASSLARACRRFSILWYCFALT